MSNVSNFPENELVPLCFADDGNWTDFARVEEFVSIANPINYEFRTNIKSTKVMGRPLSCYKDGILLKVTDAKWKQDWAEFYFLFCNGNYFQFGSEHISLINEACPPNIKKHTIVDYLKLFCFFLVGDEGSFFLVEGKDSEFLHFVPCSNELEKKRLVEILKPIEIRWVHDKKHYIVESDIIYNSVLYRAIFLVELNGNVEMLDDMIRK